MVAWSPAALNRYLFFSYNKIVTSANAMAFGFHCFFGWKSLLLRLELQRGRSRRNDVEVEMIMKAVEDMTVDLVEPLKKGKDVMASVMTQPRLSRETEEYGTRKQTSRDLSHVRMKFF
ncbi:hypothetical protein ACLOJK_035789 [Asimina triloba]